MAEESGTIRIQGEMEITIVGGTVIFESNGGPQTTGPEPSTQLDESAVRNYWEFLTESAQRYFRAFAEEQLEEGGPITFDAVGARLNISAEEARRLNRTSYRGFYAWRKRGLEPPIYAVKDAIAPRCTRKRTWRLPDGVAEIIVSFDIEAEND